MYAVTGSPREYQEHQEDDGAVTLYLIETCDSENDDRWADYAGWDMYWYNDGSPTGCICITDADCIPAPISLEIDDVFSPAQIETLRDREYTVIETPFGVRRRIISEQDWAGIDYWNITAMMGTGRLDPWQELVRRMCQDQQCA